MTLATTEDATNAVREALRLFNQGLISRNQAREMIGFEPELGGDTVYGPLAHTPLRFALDEVLYLVGSMLAAITAFVGLWNVFLGYVGPPYEASEGISRQGAGACAVLFAVVLIVALAWLRKRRGNLAASAVQHVLDAARA